jgi:hypothetical protein
VTNKKERRLQPQPIREQRSDVRNIAAAGNKTSDQIQMDHAVPYRIARQLLYAWLDPLAEMGWTVTTTLDEQYCGRQGEISCTDGLWYFCLPYIRLGLLLYVSVTDASCAACHLISFIYCFSIFLVYSLFCDIYTGMYATPIYNIFYKITETDYSLK